MPYHTPSLYSVIYFSMRGQFSNFFYLSLLCAVCLQFLNSVKYTASYFRSQRETHKIPPRRQPPLIDRRMKFLFSNSCFIESKKLERSSDAVKDGGVGGLGGK